MQHWAPVLAHSCILGQIECYNFIYIIIKSINLEKHESNSTWQYRVNRCKCGGYKRYKIHLDHHAEAYLFAVLRYIYIENSYSLFTIWEL